jgi:hypothetical protein
MTTTTMTDTQMAQLAINTIRSSRSMRSRRQLWAPFRMATGREIALAVEAHERRLALLTEYGFTVDKVVAAARAQLAKERTHA